ncbi:CDP-glycerol glycerophosphotransferase family protein [Helicobacter turcicus]|uniref:CDP-glycerol glycerophosphotransferase family protein n=1 Tax=Helicobacter turcicus TaxID=2867412 RepID=A0ABS7JMS5_9HELI|nr:CDP-glycerol glycerophosphotransferase family protein [Helicobacter turcicus]MBX7490693.1 CDP-glycerol glycerophosphotransferase family protein [Helicobacter turcicus]MBX7545398.1 CDP-glycerol glycerophosphotransferase family protein [Helicobacter turcicus]
MQYYIYPAGTNGKAIFEFLSIFEPESACVLIDDSSREHNFEFLCQNIKNDDVILIASKWNYERLCNRLKEQKIDNFINGIEWIGKKINTYIKKRRNRSKKAIGIVLQHEMIVKNFYGIDKDLEKFGYELVYIAGTRELYEGIDSKYLRTFATDALLEEIDSIDLIIDTCGEPTNLNVTSLDLTHGYQGTLHYPFADYTESDIKFFSYAAKRNNYVACGGKKIRRGYEDFFKQCGLENRAVDLGYLNLTQTFKNYNVFLKENGNFEEEVVVIGFSFLTLEDWKKQLVQGLLDAQKKVFVMAHPIFGEQIKKDFLPLFAYHTNFLQESDFKSRNEIFARSICLITDSSSVGYTYPLVTAKRCIVWTDDKEKYWTKKIGEEHYFDPRLHVLCSSVPEVLQVIHTLPESTEEFRSTIQKYREEECFHFYDSREKTLEFIQTLLK